MKKRTIPKRRAVPRKHVAPLKRKAPKPQAASTVPPVGPLLGIRRILVPIDFSAHSKNALRYAVPMAEAFGASLHLVYVVEPTIYPADLGFGQVVLPAVEDELRDKGSDELKKMIEREIGDRVKATSAVRTGKPHQEILREAQETGVDLIIVASHGHTGVEHMLFGSTASRVVRLAECPVMTIRPQMK
jgi:nucleotide-binding universal stress UspA family protein